MSIRDFRDWFAHFGATAPAQAQPPTASVFEMHSPKRQLKANWIWLVVLGALIVGALCRIGPPTPPKAPLIPQGGQPTGGTRPPFPPAALSRLSPPQPQVPQGPDYLPANPGPGPYYQLPQQQPTVDEAKQRERERRQKRPFLDVLVKIPSTSDAPAAPPERWRGQPATEPSEQAAAKPSQPTEQKPPQVFNDCKDMTFHGERYYAICEGAFLVATTMNRVSGRGGPVRAQLEQDVWSADRQHLLVPKGSVLLANAEEVSNYYDGGVAMSFSRLLMPNGKGVVLDNAVGLNQAGDARPAADKLKRHTLSTLGTAAVMGLISGFSIYGTGGYYNGSGPDMWRQSVGGNTGRAAEQILGQRLNRPPDLEVTEGHMIQVYIRKDLFLPEYAPQAGAE
jgi:type IV secretion system protein VirB10